MRKLILIGAVAAIAFASQAYAATSSQSSTTVTIAVSSSTSANGGGDFTYSASPNVQMTAITSATAYTLGSYNDKTDTTNGMEYGSTSGSSGYAQRQLTQTPLSDIGSTAGTLAGADWAWMGGS